MKVLYVVGSNLSRNTSANISHNAYVKGLLENNCEVDIVMASSSWGEKDAALPNFNEVTYFTFNSISKIDKLLEKFKKIFDNKSGSVEVFNSNESSSEEINVTHDNFKIKVRHQIKKVYDYFFTTSQVYNLDRTWLNNAAHFKKEDRYDLIISNSSPASSHKLVAMLLNKKYLKETKWIQIWEDPWYFDIYAGHNENIKKEEHSLLKVAKEIYYVSFLTLKYQKEYFPDCAFKMKHIPLPYLQFSENKIRKNSKDLSFGYFGDYYSKTRNLKPFYEALVESGTAGYINGDTDLSLQSTDMVQINGRVTLNKLSELQDQTSVLVHLCNLQGGQIPGKIYHYSATTKPIIFILDGTLEEITDIKEYFKQFNRYHFCKNEKNAILKIMNSFINEHEEFEKQPVLDFAPFQVVSKLLSK